VLLDCELLPWSAKAKALLREQYAAVGAAARAVMPVSVEVLKAAAAAGIDVSELLERTTARASNAHAFTEAYRRYCWPVDGLNGVSLAPCQVPASEGTTYHEHDHGWHLSIADRLVDAVPDLFRSTCRLVVDTDDPASVSGGITWWEDLSVSGGEGMVVKPFAVLALESEPVDPACSDSADISLREIVRINTSRQINPIMRCLGPTHCGYAGTHDGRGAGQRLDTKRLTLMSGQTQTAPSTPFAARLSSRAGGVGAGEACNRGRRRRKRPTSARK